MNKLGRLLLVFAFAVIAAGHVLAEPDYKKLKAEIPKLEKSLRLARDARDEADQQLKNNRAAQTRAQDAQLAKLKTEAKSLAEDAGKKADELATAQQTLAKKQGELRGAAAKYAVSQLDAKGALAERVNEAMRALDDWSGALGRLPDVPTLRSVDGFDPDEQDAMRTQDKTQLKAYVAWCEAEEKLIDTEVKQAQELVDGEEKVRTADDGQLLVDSAKALKITLDERKDKVQKLRKQAKKTLDDLD